MAAATSWEDAAQGPNHMDSIHFIGNFLNNWGGFPEQLLWRILQLMLED